MFEYIQKDKIGSMCISIVVGEWGRALLARAFLISRVGVWRPDQANSEFDPSHAFQALCNHTFTNVAEQFLRISTASDEKHLNHTVSMDLNNLSKKLLKKTG